MDDATRALRERVAFEAWVSMSYPSDCDDEKVRHVWDSNLKGALPDDRVRHALDAADRILALLAPADAAPDGWAVVDGDGAPLWAFWGEGGREQAQASGAYHDHPDEARIVPVYIGAAPERTADAAIDGYFYIEDGSARVPLSWQHVALMLRKAGYNVYAQPGFAAAPERTAAQRMEFCPSCKAPRWTLACECPRTAAQPGPDIHLRARGDCTWTVRIGDGAIPETFPDAFAALAAGLAARAEPQGGTHGE